MKYDKGKWIDSWDRNGLRACAHPEGRPLPMKRAAVKWASRDKGQPARERGHCFLCASYVRQDASLTSLRAKSHFFSGPKTQRPLTDRLLIEWRRASAIGGHSTKFKKA
jgi:hypothetical protein